jgi:hypothetical protein
VAEANRLPEVGNHPRDKPSVELYRSVGGTYSWRVVVLAKSASERALRDAKALAIQLDAELAEQYGNGYGLRQQ